MRSHLTKKRSLKDRENYLFQEDSQGCAQSGECRVGRKQARTRAREHATRVHFETSPGSSLATRSPRRENKRNRRSMSHILSKLRRGGELNGGGNGIVVVTSDQERTRGWGCNSCAHPVLRPAARNHHFPLESNKYSTHKSAILIPRIKFKHQFAS